MQFVYFYRSLFYCEAPLNVVWGRRHNKTYVCFKVTPKQLIYRMNGLSQEPKIRLVQGTCKRLEEEDDLSIPEEL